MARIKGITVILIDKVMEGRDDFGHPIYRDVEIEVENVLVAPTSSADNVINQLNLTGRKGTYTLGIPKGDTHTWEGREVRFFGRRWKTVGLPMEGIDHLIPLDWNKKVMVERYE
ncbi:Phage-associated protein [Streptococcus sp. DD10]|uniref:hypothetical protein n=1 Tax=Streptococcus sp. DD10 TaxID=1777878 RepID=UPI0007925407|nr:hypothetical protein [Streptococcus sp. DD10]KXT73194.1 Phage-associated protein [Streptococcus sp. DD10]